MLQLGNVIMPVVKSPNGGIDIPSAPFRSVKPSLCAACCVRSGFMAIPVPRSSVSRRIVSPRDDLLGELVIRRRLNREPHPTHKADINGQRSWTALWQPPRTLIPNMSAATRIALVTGGAQGIGESIALRLAQDGLDVAILDVKGKEEQLEGVAKKIQDTGRRALTLVGDISSEEAVIKAVEDVVAALGSLDVVSAPNCSHLLMLIASIVYGLDDCQCWRLFLRSAH